MDVPAQGGWLLEPEDGFQSSSWGLGHHRSMASLYAYSSPLTVADNRNNSNNRYLQIFVPSCRENRLKDLN